MTVERRQFRDSELIEIALEKFRGFKTNKELAEQFNRYQSQISGAVRRAFEEGLVEVVEVTRKPKIQINEELQKRLRDRYPDLQQAIVVDTSLGHPSLNKRDQAVSGVAGIQKGESPRGLAESREAGDKLHAMLGEALASHIQAIFRTGDRLGLGSGRGVFHTVESLRSTSSGRIRVEEIQLIALTGGAHVLHHHTQNTVLDADHLVARLGECFAGQNISLRLVSRPIACTDDVRLGADREKTPLGKGQWTEKRRPTHAITGVGVLCPGHRFYDAVVYEQDARSTKSEEIDDINMQLTDLVKISQQVSEACAERFVQNYYPVADICNRLFLVPPESRRADSETVKGILDDSIGELWPRLRDQVEKVNKCLLTVSEPQLRDIDNIMLVAGGAPKAMAIRHFLDERQHLKVRILCTDSATARQILGSFT